MRRVRELRVGLISMLLTVSVATTAMLGSIAGAADAAAPVVPTVDVQVRALRVPIRLDASFAAIYQSTIAAQASGTIVQLPLTAGDRVRTGQVIAQIDTRDADASLARARGALAQARAERIDAVAAWERSRTLVDRGFLSGAALDAAQARLAAARAAEEQAGAAVRQAALMRDFTTVRAPWDGVATIVYANAGDLAAPGLPIASIHAPGQIRAIAHVPLSLVPAVRDASAVSVELSSGEILVPSKRILVPEIDRVAQTQELRLEFSTMDDFPAVPGQHARVHFTGAEAARRTIPRAAVVQRGELQAVYVAQGERFALRAVRLGRIHGDEAEVLAGLRDGERVALDPVRAGLAAARPARATH